MCNNNPDLKPLERLLVDAINTTCAACRFQFGSTWMSRHNDALLLTVRSTINTMCSMLPHYAINSLDEETANEVGKWISERDNSVFTDLDVDDCNQDFEYTEEEINEEELAAAQVEMDQEDEEAAVEDEFDDSEEHIPVGFTDRQVGPDEDDEDHDGNDSGVVGFRSHCDCDSCDCG